MALSNHCLKHDDLKSLGKINLSTCPNMPDQLSKVPNLASEPWPRLSFFMVLRQLMPSGVNFWAMANGKQMVYNVGYFPPRLLHSKKSPCVQYCTEFLFYKCGASFSPNQTSIPLAAGPFLLRRRAMIGSRLPCSNVEIYCQDCSGQSSLFFGLWSTETLFVTRCSSC